MARQGVTLMCCWNGNITSGPNGISYEGATPRPIRVSNDTIHNDLLEKMCRSTGFDRQPLCIIKLSDPGVLTCRQRLGTMTREWQVDQRIRQFVILSGFYGMYRIRFIQLDWPLITALVERWRQETLSFHFAVGESTVTLQDVAVLLGLRVHGSAVTGGVALQWDDPCEELLWLRQNPNALHGYKPISATSIICR
ncbi:hypothetical protein Dsin_030596 [Dipteronia sinensis]|uniref:Aminotransferase-like plant mobile domain-containing protein n=1 Tax=Dipteronia sinensis TaxID=43782 RepID=A0AAD9ZJY0_9ROSI|nr:hypothetical protein Dsin_030596 [Dipteronia sinensis]